MNNCGEPSHLGTITLEGEKYLISRIDQNVLDQTTNMILVHSITNEVVILTYDRRESILWI